MTTINEDLSVGELAGRDHRKAEVFRKYGIDFCCGGGQTLAQAAVQAGITEGELRSALQVAELATAKPEHNFASLPIAALIDHIIGVHHEYVRKTLPVLLEYGRKVAGHHGDKHPPLRELDLEIRAESQELLEHLEKEEGVLFPAMLKLVTASASGTPPVSGTAFAPASGAACSLGEHNLHFIGFAIERMLADHRHSGQRLDTFRALTNGYTPPEWACNSFRFLYEKLKEFDNDLQEHIHLENNILFPRVLDLLKHN